MRLLLFSRDTCGSCKKWKPVCYQIAEELGIELQEMDDKEEMKERSIKGLPTTLLLDDDGKEIWSILGNVNRDKAINDLRGFINGGKGD